VLIGKLTEMTREEERESFELFRKSLNWVIVQTYDELFAGIAWNEVWRE
jgi:hypothetical protein